MNTIKTQWIGVRPLIMHSWRMIDADNPHVRKKAELQRQLKKAKKDDEVGRERIRRQIERAEWEGSMYWTPEMGMYCPGANIAACIVAGARKMKCGKQVEQGLIPPVDVPFKTICATTDLEKLYAKPEFSLRTAVRIPPKTGARLMAVRPMVPTGWSLTFELEFDAEIIPEKDLIEAMHDAGALMGLGDWRPGYGRFRVEML